MTYQFPSHSGNMSALSASIPEVFQERPWGSTAVLGVVLYLIVEQIRYYRKTPNITSIGFIPVPIIGRWVAAIRFLVDPVKAILEGVARSPNGMFRIATLQEEFVIITDRHKVTEYLKAPDSVLSAQQGANDQQQIPYTMGYGVGHRTYHTQVVRGPITKAIGPKTPLMVDEASLALDDLIGSPNDWTPISLYDTIAMMVARISSRVYVGKSFCLNKEYLQNSADYAQAVVISAEILRVFPEWTKGFITRFLPVMKYRRAAERILGPYIQDRLDGKTDEYGNKPDDLVQQLIDAAPPVEKTMPQISERIMALNVASIHTSTMLTLRLVKVLTAALYSLSAEYDKYAPELRQEVADNLVNGEITAETLKNLPKAESFLRESGRFNLPGLMTMQRNALKEFRFSDGTVLPVGTKVGACSKILHYDPEVYQNPEVFDGFRFLDPKYAEVKENSPVNTSRSFHVFGHGRHPCPGRFLAVQEMKIMLSLLLLQYDFKLAPGDSPKPMMIGTMALPDTFLKVQFKARSEV
ncbi:cytochrome P450 [Plectosphaerella plurivora]|uniref:Cytochrome P450 n=1 Tax=Plectosphaerella plurivora TaxID=936078 RepID=A0A9P9AAA0_9PEZI|nr:cytochrome P450 [Plectosphaerella plurivora]